jgi:hypothetical protein
VIFDLYSVYVLYYVYWFPYVNHTCIAWLEPTW